MLPAEFKQLKLIPAHELEDGFERIPPDPGVYLWFVRGGKSMLLQSRYFDTDARPPLEIGDHAHLYTGAANNLRFRISQHVRNKGHENSSPRKSLCALEFMFGAVSQAVESKHDIMQPDGLSDWIYENVLFGFEVNPNPFVRESDLINRYGSAFNLTGRRQHRYSKWLMAWRAAAFPPDWMKTLPVSNAPATVITGAPQPRRRSTRTRSSSGSRPQHRRRSTVEARATFLKSPKAEIGLKRLTATNNKRTNIDN